MENRKTIVVVGGVAGGMSFATRYRRLNQKDRIIIVDKNPYVSFANCGLPYYISGEISDREDLIVVEEETLKNRFDLDIRTNEEVIKINPEEKSVITKSDQGENKISYDKLILSPGAKPTVLNIEGLDTHPGVFTLRNIPDIDQITGYINLIKPKSATVIGGGFIGLEVVENLIHLGMEVNLIQRSNQILPPFDPEMAIFAEKELVKNGVNLYKNSQIDKIEGNILHLNNGKVLESDMLIMAVGVSPETGFLEGSGIELGMKKGIKVDDKYKTSVDDIYAVGDAIVVKHNITKEDAIISLASPANRQGRQLADMLSGMNHKLTGSLGTSIVRIFSKAFASTGLNEKQLKGKNYQSLHLLANSHAGYYPGAEDILLKVIYDKDTKKILGAQGIGKDGVDKRIDILATAIKAGMNVNDLQELELAYAPPFGSAKDIINMVGYYSENVILGLTNPVQINELKGLMEEGYKVIDVRDEDEYSVGHIKGATNLPLDSLRENIDTLDKDEKYIVHCRSSVRSYNAERILKEAGFNVSNLDGSYFYFSNNYPDEVEKWSANKNL